MAPYEPSITDKYTLSELPQDVIEALDFWAAVTPDQPALKIPRGEIPAEGMATITFFEWMQARNLLAAWLACDLAVGAPGRLGGSTCECTLAFLIAPNHEVINPWFAMAALGFTVQFISPLHTPKIVASLIRASQAHVVLHHGMDSGWIKEVEAMTRESGKPLEFRELSSNQLLVPIVEHFRKTKTRSPSVIGPMLHAVKPQPFVYLHTFGSTANPKLYPIDYQAANMSAKDAAFWCHQQPVEKRWKCQMQTSLPFHLSFQNPVWRSLMCGTACAFPVLGASFTTIPMAKLVPDPPELLDSLCLSKADIVYASPDLLQAMLEKAASHNSKEIWREAVRNLKEAHTGGAPVSVEKADCFERHGLSVLQVFALTEAGLLFQGRKEHTGHLTWLKPLPSKKTHMLFRQTAADPELYQLWLRSDFPGLRCPSDKIVPYPEDPKILAWNTLDTFRKLPTMGEHDDLVTFAGREDDWLRCTHGTAVRALELEDFLLEALRDVLGFDRVRALTIIGHGRYALGIVLQGNTLGRVPEDREVEAFERVWHFASKKLLQNPEQVRYLIRTDLTSPIQMTLKGNPLRGHNEIRFGPKLVQLIKDAEAKASTSEKEP